MGHGERGNAMSRHESEKWPATGFGRRLRELRDGRALSRRELAEAAGCHPMTLAKMELGTREPGWPLVLALAKALGLTPNDFLT
jgi:transcriptional regulator with XRE-family HTH domain